VTDPKNESRAKEVAETMSPAVIAAGYGGAEVLKLIDEPAREPGPGEARIKVRAAALNPIDYKVYSGQFGTDPAQLPIRLGMEAAGVVTAAGSGAAGPAGPVTAGDEVIAYRVSGAYAAELMVPAGSLVPKPAALDWAQASGLMVAGTTAWHALAATGVRDGDTVLVHGGSGGVGLMAVQLAVLRGATVVATASPPKHDLLREFGAVPVAYGRGLADRVRAAVPGGIDATLDLVGTDEAMDASLELVADRARIATIVGFARGQREGVKLLGGVPGADPGTGIRQAARLELTRLAGENRLRVVVSQTFPLAHAADAHRALMTGHAIGKTALIP
jgi:NADPH:quinone reductase